MAGPFDQTFEELRDLYAVTRNGSDSFLAYCPVCETDGVSNTPSCSVSRGTRGAAVLAYCHSGKGEPHNGLAILTAFAGGGISPVDQLAQRRTRKRWQSVVDDNPSRVVRRINYDYGGGRVKRRIEFEDGSKTFTWVGGKPKDGPVIFPRPPIDEERSKILLLVEGEKCALALRQVGVCAFSVEDWRTENVQAFEGCRVGVLRDYDRTGARKRNAALAALPEALAVELPGLEERESGGLDVLDWLGSGHNVKELESLVIEAFARPRPRTFAHFERSIAAHVQGSTWRTTVSGNVGRVVLESHYENCYRRRRRSKRTGSKILTGHGGVPCRSKLCPAYFRTWVLALGREMFDAWGEREVRRIRIEDIPLCTVHAHRIPALALTCPERYRSVLANGDPVFIAVPTVKGAGLLIGTITVGEVVDPMEALADALLEMPVGDGFKINRRSLQTRCTPRSPSDPGPEPERCPEPVEDRWTGYAEVEYSPQGDLRLLRTDDFEWRWTEESVEAWRARADRGGIVSERWWRWYVRKLAFDLETAA